MYEWGIPLLIGILCYCLSIKYNNNLYDIIEKIFPFITTLLGFTMAALTLFLTGNKNIENTKQYITTKTLRGKRISLYEFIIISFSYLIIIESLMCVFFFIGLLFPYTNGILSIVFNCVFIVLSFNILLMTIRTITDLYFIITKK